MAISITSALFKDNDEVKELHTSDIDSILYSTRLKGNLYCTTENCNARLVFVNSTSKSSHFKTYPHDNHSEHCIYQFERVPGRIGVNTEQTINVSLSEDHKKRSLKEAFSQSRLTAQQLEVLREKRKLSRRRPKTQGRQNSITINPVTNNDVEDDIKEQVRSREPSILKRYVDTITQSDIGKHRLIIGNATNIYYRESSILLEIERNRNKLTVKFGEAFFASSPNFKGLFTVAEKFISENKLVIFTGIGELKKANELIIYNGEDFNLQGLQLPAIAAIYARNKLG
ncbi:hypothetical protein [Paucisalibacillus sp. EB02]|uniref:hypothetical protein n=1 Tax=Paucisalibacillus sp. EB02 TaxID=1347087 RepID=UPI0004B64563|nr:hypothetical protein [Paucisalibacillus sp. EB02]